MAHALVSAGLESSENDLCRRRKLYQVQVHGLRRGLSGRLLLRRREHARHSPRRMHRLRGLEPECPVEAIKPDTEPGLEKLLKLNADFAKIWPNITAKKDPPEDAKEWETVSGKIKHFSEKGGTGD